ncbi:MAG TPA: hypothetical protein VK578_12650 [Edaphobacter sp.]|jgi:hypothetical protein|nr:hypothetical protein [Edaphobacter sp.]
MKWNWFGWFGLLNLAVFVFLTLSKIRVDPDGLAYRFVSISLLFAMLSTILSPIIASVRASKWWLLVSGCGVLVALWFFARISV